MKTFNSIIICSFINFVYSTHNLTPSYLPTQTPTSSLSISSLQLPSQLPSQYPSQHPSQVPSQTLSQSPSNKEVSTYVKYNLRGNYYDNNTKYINFYIINYDVIYQTSNDSDTPCCLVCPPNKSMYYSIDTNKDMCGQTCIYDNMFFIYKLFEPGLTKANNSLICPKKGYEQFVSTVTHSFLFLKDTLDLYKPFNYYAFRDLKY